MQNSKCKTLNSQFCKSFGLALPTRSVSGGETLHSLGPDLREAAPRLHPRIPNPASNRLILKPIPHPSYSFDVGRLR